MGLLSMLNFISGAIAAGVYGKAVDQGASFSFNPVNSHPDAAVFSNIYLVLAVLLAGILVFYSMKFGKDKALNAPRMDERAARS